MKAINPYLNFPGNTEEVFGFYKAVFGGEFSRFQRFSDTEHGAHLPEGERDKLMHVTLTLPNGTELMGTDALESMGHRVTSGTNISLAVMSSSKAEADQLFNGLSAGGTVTMPLEETFWGAYFGMCNDKFGIQWMINFDL